MSPVLVFDIETVPDVAGIRKLHSIAPEVSDEQVAAMAFQLRRQKVGHDFLPLHLQRVIAISCALADRDSFRVWSLAGESEGEIIQRFFDGIEKYTPQLVSWNGGGFDLPVLHYRGLIHSVRAPRMKPDTSRPREIDHLWLRTRDVSAARRFYETIASVVGLRVAYESPERVRYTDGVGSFSFVEGDTPTEHVHLAFGVADVASVARFHEVATRVDPLGQRGAVEEMSGPHPRCLAGA